MESPAIAPVLLHYPVGDRLTLVGVTAHMISGGADKEVEVGARVGLLYVVHIEPLPAAYGIGKAGEGGGVGPAADQFVLQDLERQGSAGHVEGDLVSGLH